MILNLIKYCIELNCKIEISSERTLNTTYALLQVNLEIKSCKPTDSGVYTCRLSSRLGTDKSKGKVEVRKIFKEPTFEEKFLDVEQVAFLCFYSNSQDDR